MPRKSTKKTLKPVRPQLGDGVEILNAGSVLEDPITRTLETNYMPYAMSVIVSRQGRYGRWRSAGSRAARLHRGDPRRREERRHRLQPGHGRCPYLAQGPPG